MLLRLAPFYPFLPSSPDSHSMNLLAVAEMEPHSPAPLLSIWSDTSPPAHSRSEASLSFKVQGKLHLLQAVFPESPALGTYQPLWRGTVEDTRGKDGFEDERLHQW